MFVVTTVHFRGQHLETPVTAPDALTAASVVLGTVVRAGAVVRLAVDAREGRLCALRPQTARDVPTHSRCLVTFTSGRTLELSFRGAPATALERVRDLLATGWEDQGPVIGFAAGPLSAAQYATAEPAAWVQVAA